VSPVVVYITTDGSTLYGNSFDCKEHGWFVTFFDHQKQRTTFLHFVVTGNEKLRQTYCY